MVAMRILRTRSRAGRPSMLWLLKTHPTGSLLATDPGKRCRLERGKFEPACHTRVVWQYRHAMAHCRGRLPPIPAPPETGCPQFDRPAATVRRRRSLPSTQSTCASRRTCGMTHLPRKLGLLRQPLRGCVRAPTRRRRGTGVLSNRLGAQRSGQRSFHNHRSRLDEPPWLACPSPVDRWQARVVWCILKLCPSDPVVKKVPIQAAGSPRSKQTPNSSANPLM